MRRLRSSTRGSVQSTPNKRKKISKSTGENTAENSTEEPQKSNEACSQKTSPECAGSEISSATRTDQTVDVETGIDTSTRDCPSQIKRSVEDKSASDADSVENRRSPLSKEERDGGKHDESEGKGVADNSTAGASLVRRSDHDDRTGEGEDAHDVPDMPDEESCTPGSSTGLSVRGVARKKGFDTENWVTADLDKESTEAMRSKFAKDTIGFLKSVSWSSSPPPLFGIDFGTSNSVVSVLDVTNPLGVKVWKDTNGTELRPTIVSFGKMGVKFACKALDDMIKSPENVITNVKGFFGRHYAHEHIDILKARKPFKVSGDSSEPGANVIFEIPALHDHMKLMRDLMPEEVAACFFRHLRDDIVCRYPEYSCDLILAVITVPAWFSTAMVNAVIEAAHVGGFRVLRTINEPTAAAYALMFRDFIRMSSGEFTLIYDFGGGTFDVTIIEENKGKIDVVANEGNIILGGEMIDAAFRDMIFKRNISSSSCRSELESLRSKPEEWAKFLELCSRAKIRLFDFLSASIDLHQVNRDYSQKITVRRAVLAAAAKPIVDKTIEHIDKAMTLKNIKADQVHRVVLVGGSSRLHVVQNILRKKFGAEKVIAEDVDTIVSIGAAITALQVVRAYLPTSMVASHADIFRKTLCDSIALPLGISVLRFNADGTSTPDVFSPIVAANTIYPFTGSRVFHVTHGSGTGKIVLYEGVHEYVKDNDEYGVMQFSMSRDLYDQSDTVMVDLVSLELGEVAVSVSHARRNELGRYVRGQRLGEQSLTIKRCCVRTKDIMTTNVNAIFKKQRQLVDMEEEVSNLPGLGEDVLDRCGLVSSEASTRAYERTLEILNEIEAGTFDDLNELREELQSLLVSID